MPKTKRAKQNLASAKVSPTALDKLRIISNLLFSITQVLAGFIFQYLSIGKGIADQSDNSKTPVIPAGYTFSIWGAIFLTSFIYAVYQALPQNRTKKIFRDIGFYTALTYLFCTVWELVAQFISFGLPTLFVIILILIPALIALFKVVNITFTKNEKWLIYLPISMTAGWVSVATFANFSSVLRQLNLYPFSISLSALSSIILVSAGVFASFVIFKTKNVIYSATIIWALIGILGMNIFVELNEYIAYLVIFLIITVAISYILSRDD